MNLIKAVNGINTFYVDFSVVPGGASSVRDPDGTAISRVVRVPAGSVTVSIAGIYLDEAATVSSGFGAFALEGTLLANGVTKGRNIVSPSSPGATFTMDKVVGTDLVVTLNLSVII